MHVNLTLESVNKVELLVTQGAQKDVCWGQHVWVDTSAQHVVEKLHISSNAAKFLQHGRGDTVGFMRCIDPAADGI